MAKSTGIILTASGIAFANDWYQTGDPNFRIVMGGLGAALFMTGLEKLSQPAAVGISVITLITVLATPIDGHSPADTVNQIIGNEQPKKKKKKVK